MKDHILQTVAATLQDITERLIAHSPTIILSIIIFISSFYIAGKLSEIVLRKTTRRSDDPLLAKFLGGVAKWLTMVTGIILALYFLGLGGIAGGMVAGAGISAIIVGFAFKDIAENFLAGIILAFSRPYRIGDTIESGNFLGNVLSLDIRNTQIKTLDGKDVFIPNSIILKNPLTNYTKDGYLRMSFFIGIDYNENLGDVFGIIYGEMEKVEGVLRDGRKTEIYVEELATSTVNISVYFWINTFDKRRSALEIKSNAIDMVKTRLIENGVVMPADISELKIYRDDTPIPIRIEDGDH